MSKAAGLRRLSRDLPVPSFSVLDQAVFEAFQRESGIRDLVQGYWRYVVRSDDDEIERVREELIRAMLHSPFSPEVEEELHRCFDKAGGTPIFARSSASCEDGADGSWAGLFTSYANLSSSAEWTAAVRACWAAILSPRVAAYARGLRVEGAPPAMEVVAQRQVDAVAAGVVFSRGPIDEGNPVLEATIGFGSPLVSGRATPERWIGGDEAVLEASWRRGPILLQPVAGLERPGSTRRLTLPSGQRLGLRGSHDPERSPYWIASLSDSPTSVRILPESLAASILGRAREREEVLGAPVELEWAIDAAGQIWWLQERPITHRIPQLSEPPESGPSGGMVVATGLVGALGCGSGPASFSTGTLGGEAPAVLFTDYTTPEDVPAIAAAAAVATREGGILSHTAIVCRELGIPCLISLVPFPPPVGEGDQVILDAGAGEVRRMAPGFPVPAAVARPTPAVFLRAPQPTDFVAGEIEVPPEIAAHLPASLNERIRSAATVPGMCGRFQVLPDVLAPHAGLGFPIGCAFRSYRVHPTAVGDCGDGFCLVRVEGLAADEVEARREALGAYLLNGFEAASPPAPAGRPGETDPGEAAAVGLPLLSRAAGNAYVEHVQFGGSVAGGSFRFLPRPLLPLAGELLSTVGHSGHFLELLAGSHGETFLLLHTGSADLGLQVLRHAVRIGAPVAAKEGQDDPADIAEGLWGLDSSERVGAELAETLLGLVNFSFVRRFLLVSAAVAALERFCGKPLGMSLLSDRPHTYLRPVGSSFAYFQGAQIVEGPGPASLVLAGAPRVRSFHVTGKVERPTVFGHGKTNYGPCPSPSPGDRERIRAVAHGCWLSGSRLRLPDPHVADWQAGDAVRLMAERLTDSCVEPLRPLVSMRGFLNGRRKLPI